MSGDHHRALPPIPLEFIHAISVQVQKSVLKQLKKVFFILFLATKRNKKNKNKQIKEKPQESEADLYKGCVVHTPFHFTGKQSKIEHKTMGSLHPFTFTYVERKGEGEVRERVFCSVLVEEKIPFF